MWPGAIPAARVQGDVSGIGRQGVLQDAPGFRVAFLERDHHAEQVGNLGLVRWNGIRLSQGRFGDGHVTTVAKGHRLLDQGVVVLGRGER